MPRAKIRTPRRHAFPSWAELACDTPRQPETIATTPATTPPGRQYLPDVFGVLERHENQLRQQQVRLDALIYQSKNDNVGSATSFAPLDDDVRLRIQYLEDEVKLMKSRLQEKGVPTGEAPGDPCFDKTVRSGEIDVGELHHSWQPISGGSIWESCIILGNPSLGLSVDLLLLFGVLVNITLQIVFCLIVWANFTEGGVDDDAVEAIKHWRGTIGHSAAFLNPVSGTTLVSQLCGEDQSTSFASAQFILNEGLGSYLAPSHPLFVSTPWLNGHLLCIISLILWLSTLFADLIQNFNFLIAMISLPRGPPLLVHAGEEMQIASFSKLQLASVVMLSVIPRAIVSGGLGWFGIKYLAATPNIEDLLLNAMSLAFVLHVDELVFEILVPRRAKSVIEKLAPIDLTGNRFLQLRFLRDGVAWVAAKIAILATLLIVADLTVLQPYQERLHDASRWLCDGRRDFTYAANKITGVTFFATTTAHEDSYDPDYTETNVLNFTGLLGAEGLLASEPVEDSPDWWEEYAGVANYMDEWQVVRDMQSSPTAFSAQWPAVCKEFGASDDFDAPQVEALKAFLGNDSLATCYDVNQSLCFLPHMKYMRGTCPKMCGCVDPWSGNFYTAPQHGCPTACNYDFQQALENKWHLPQSMAPYIDACDDIPPNLLNDDIAWRRYISVFYPIVQSISQSLTLDFTVSMGCNALKIIIRGGYDPCDPMSAGGRSARPWCPRMCGCTGNMKECPGEGCKCEMGSCTTLHSSPPWSAKCSLEICSSTEGDEFIENHNVQHYDEVHDAGPGSTPPGDEMGNETSNTSNDEPN